LGDAGVLTREALEQRLLDFVRGKLIAPELSSTVDSQTRLFELRIVDSLKILELIAFIESVIGRKIPDAQVVLANFRSIETMARVFSVDGDLAATRSRRPARQTRVFQNAAEHRYSNAAQTLFERGDIKWDGSGGLHLHGAARTLLHFLDSTALGWARELGAVEEVFSDTIATESLGRAGFLTAFPEKVVAAIGDPGFVMPPAVCYHYYPHLAHRAVDAAGATVTACGRCYRNETNDVHPIERLRAFTMREIIAVGSESFVEAMRHDLMDRVGKWITELKLAGFIETASDPFFTSETRGRRLMQQLQPLKYELRLQVSSDQRSVAAASFNHHRDHFTKAFSIRVENGESAHSGCVAFGWERWIIAFVAQHGADEENWPETVRGRYAVTA
jgi:seryl-tRNA synthetase